MKLTLKQIVNRILHNFFNLFPYDISKKFEIWLMIIFRREFMGDGKKYFYISKKITTQPKYLVIRYALPNCGIFAAANLYLFAYEYAIERGFIPVVYWEWEGNVDKHDLSLPNLWDAYFKQQITFKDVLQKDYVVVETFGYPLYLSKTCKSINGNPIDYHIHFKEENWREYYKNVKRYTDKWLCFNDDINRYFLESCEQLFGDDKILGVSIREEFTSTFYDLLNDAAKEMYKQHPCNPPIEDIISLVKQYKSSWGYNYIFLATNVQDTVDLFVSEFGDDVLFLDRERYTMESLVQTAMENFGNVNAHPVLSGSEHYKKTAPYITEVRLLSCCDSLIAARSSGALMALVINGGEYKHYFPLNDSRNISRY